MNSELVHRITETAQKAAERIHTAIPATIVSYDPAKGQATVKPTMKFTTQGGNIIDYPQVSGVPVVYQQHMGQKATIGFPVKPGDGCLLVVSEQSLDYWMYGQDTGTNLKFDLTNAIAIPGLFSKANAVVKEACEQDAIIVDVSGTRLTVKSDGLIQADCKKFVINASESFKVNAGRIDLN